MCHWGLRLGIEADNDPLEVRSSGSRGGSSSSISSSRRVQGWRLPKVGIGVELNGASGIYSKLLPITVNYYSVSPL